MVCCPRDSQESSPTPQFDSINSSALSLFYYPALTSVHYWKNHSFDYSNVCGQSTHAKSLQSCPTLCNPMDCSPPGSSVHGILQARILQWVAVSFSRGPGERLPSPSLSKHLHSWPQSFLCKIMIGIILLLFSRGKIKSFHLSLTK